MEMPEDIDQFQFLDLYVPLDEKMLQKMNFLTGCETLIKFNLGKKASTGQSEEYSVCEASFRNRNYFESFFFREEGRGARDHMGGYY